MSDISLFHSFAKGEKAHLKRGTNCVIYTRVSSKEQAENLSLTTQLKGCNLHAEKMRYTVLAHFGGTYESAATDERRQFTAMIDFVKKSKVRVSYILVYSLERFSRNENSLWLSSQLRKLGIEIVSVTQPIDTSNSSGQMQQKLLLIFGEFDNQLRKEKCMAGVKERLLEGTWPTKPPIGFETVRENGKRKIVINAKGKLLRKAFYWKAQEKITSEAIRERLAKKGLKVSRQRMSDIFRNPFYCGLMVHNMLEGKVVPGNQELLVSKELFLKVNGIVNQNTHGYTVNEINNALPLKKFVRCEGCGKSMSGYIVKKKNIHYYKCSGKGCCNNKSAKDLHNTFASILEYFKVGDPGLTSLIKAQSIASFNQLTKGLEDQNQLLHQQYGEVKKKIDRLEERFIEEEITSELYNKYFEKYRLEKAEIEKNLEQSPKGTSNLAECVDMTLNFVAKVPNNWMLADYLTRQQIQNLIFPDGLVYSKKNDGVLTQRINSMFLQVAYFKQVTAKKKSGIPELNLDFAALSALVERKGFEPSMPFWSIHTFQACAFDHSATSLIYCGCKNSIK